MIDYTHFSAFLNIGADKLLGASKNQFMICAGLSSPSTENKLYLAYNLSNQRRKLNRV